MMEIKAQQEASAKAIDVSTIEKAFKKAISKGVSAPKLRLSAFKFSLAKSTSQNPGAIYVVDHENDCYLGKILNSKFFKTRECSSEQENSVIETCSDPAKAAIAYGRRTGICAICGRELETAESIERGIGPICADKFDF